MLLLSTSSLQGYGLHRIFRFASEAEYDGIDLSLDFGQYDTYNAEYLAELSKITGISVKSITMPEKQVSTGQVDFCLQLAEQLNVGMVNIHPPHRLEKEKDWFGDYLKILQEKHTHQNINIINAPPKTWMFIISEYGDARPETIKKMTQHTALSIANIDPNSGVDLMRTFYLLGSTLKFVYLSDKRDEEGGIFPGDGLMPLESLLIKLRDTKYKGHFALQISPTALGAGDDQQVKKELLRAKKYLEKYYSEK